mgnify:CR=1 FL=1
MNVLKKFQIDIANLVPGKYEYEFEVNNAFFEGLDQTLVEKGSFEVKLKINKSTNIIKGHFHIVGKVELTCDRSLTQFDYPMAIDQEMIYKFGDKNEELSDTEIMIKPETVTIDVAPVIFDLIAINIPAKKINPEYLTEKDKDMENDILVYSSVNDDKELTDNDIDINDPRWEALKKLKDAF